MVKILALIVLFGLSMMHSNLQNKEVYIHFKGFWNVKKIYDAEINLKLFVDSTFAYCSKSDDLEVCTYSKWIILKDTLFLHPVPIEYRLKNQRDYIEKYLMKGDELIPIISEKQITLIKVSDNTNSLPSKRKFLKFRRRNKMC